MTKYFLKDGRTLQQYFRDTKDCPPLKTINYRVYVLGWDLDRAVSTPSQTSVKHMVHGVSFRKYCKDNGLPYEQLHLKWRHLSELNKRHRKEGITPEEVVDNYVNGVKYNFDDVYVSDKQYCIDKGLKYTTTYVYWRQNFVDKMSFRQYIDFKASQPKRMSMKKYCQDKGYNYASLYGRWYYCYRDIPTFKDFVKEWELKNGYSSEIT